MGSELRLTITKASDPDSDHPTVVGDIMLVSKSGKTKYFLVRNCGRDCHVLIREKKQVSSGVVLSADSPSADEV